MISPKFIGRTSAVRRRRLLSLAAAALIVFQPVAFLVSPASADTGTGTVSLTTTGTAVTQNFDTLANTAGSTTNTTLPTGWYITEAGGGARDNEQYAVDTGGSTTGDIYSYGAAGNTDRALGALRSGTLIPLFGAKFTNNTGSTITSLDISYAGEEWRLGTAARTDRIDFQISTNATDLSTGTYTDVDALDFTTPNTATTGAKDGNLAANRTVITSSISGLSIANGATFFIRWTDLDASGADDGLAIDDFNITAQGGPAVDSAPTVTSTSPADNATSVAVNSNISVTFSEPVTATADSFQISCATSGAHAFTLSGGATTYTLDPTTDFTQGEVCTVTVVAAQVTDQDGTPNQMAANYVFDFTVINTAPVPIHTIQGSGTASPLAGQTVTTSGIVTLLKTATNNGGAASGFFLQAPDASADADPNTSEGIFVFTSTVPTVSVGDSVNVTGTVVEFNGMTEISPVSSVSVNSTGNTLPTAVTLTTTILDPTALPTQPQLEKYEGMRLAAASLTTVAPNDNFFDVYTVITGVPRPLREPGIEISQPVPPDPTTGTPDCCIPRWDENPERLLVDTNGRAGSTLNAYTSNVVLTNISGPLDFAFDQYRLISDSTPAASPNMSAVPVPTPTAGEFTVGGFNVENFNNNATQRQKAALAIRDVMRLPDIIGMVEIFELTGLQALAAEINTISPGANYQAFLVEADGTAGDADQDVGYLVNTARVQVDSVTQIELAGCQGNAATCNTFIDPNTGQPAYLNDRPPLVLRAHVQPTGANVPVIVVVNHLRSFIDIETITGEGPRVRAKRKAQSEFLADLLQDLQTDNPATSVISVGDYNAYQFSDGYTDPIATIKGNPTPDDQIVVDQSPDLVNPNFFNLVDELPAAERYSFIFEGTPQALDHVIVNNVAHARNTRFAIARNNSDFPEVPAAAFASNAARPERNSDHDMPVAFFALAGPVSQPGSVLISEFRFNGPNGTGDEFIELYNNSDSPVNLSGWTIVAPAGTGGGGVLNGLTGILGARGHYLVAPSDYSVSGYPAGVGGTAVPDMAYTGGAFLDDGGAKLVDANGGVIDAVGFSSTNGTGFREGAGLSPATGITPGAGDQYSFVRRMATGSPQDTNDNAADFVLVSTTGAAGATAAVLGAPGPENTQSPILRNAVIKASLIDNCNGIGFPGSGCQNIVRDGSAGASNPTNAQHGTISFRRKFTNTTMETVTRLRFRVVNITTLNSPGYAPNNGQADLRLLSSANTTVTPSNPFTEGDVFVRGTTLEQPPTQALGGGLNSTVTIDLSQPLAGGASVTVQFLVGVQQNGGYRFFVNVEALSVDPVLTQTKGPSEGKAGKN
ncbi:MAG TPA: Ig-like domain-containing protein [Pyrinomonadaceae bacterium]|nr:Ig-like domain-containing protein [Pyrinomonadaceae bacterium]